MLSFIKIIFYICLILLALIIAGLIYLVFFVDPNQYKVEIVKNIQQSTGRAVVIEGMQWTFYPSLSIKINDLKLGNPPSFPTGSFLLVKDAYISAAFWPLWRGQLQGKITLDTLNLHLIKNASGQVNWQVSPKRNVNSSHDSSPSPQKKQASFFKVRFKLKMASIHELNLKNSSIIYEDQQKNKKIVLDQINLKSYHIALNKAFPVQTSFILKASSQSKPVNITVNTEILYNLDKIRLQPINAKTNQYDWQGWLEMDLRKKDASALNGHLIFSGKNGGFQGIDLYYYADLAESIGNQTQPTRQDTHTTPFESINGTLDIQKGIVTNHDLLIKAQEIEAAGQGTADLVNQQLDYQISLQRLTSGEQIKPRGPAIPLMISGTFSDPKIRPDWRVLAITEVKSRLREQLEKHKDVIPQGIQQGLQALLGNG